MSQPSAGASIPPPDLRRAPPQKWRLIAGGLFGVTLVVGIFYAFGPDLSALADPPRLDLGYAASAWVASALTTLVTARRWQRLHEAWGGTRLRFGAYVHALAISRFLAQVLPAALVEVMGRGAALRRAGSPDSWKRLSGGVVLERIADLVFPIVLLGWGLALVSMTPRWAWAALAICVVAAFSFTVEAWQALAKGIVWIRQRSGAGKDAPALPRFALSLRAALVGWSILRYAGLVVQFWALGAAVGTVVPALRIIAASAVAQLSMVIAMTPGGLGFQEGGWAAGLAWQGVSAQDATWFIIAVRAGLLVNFGVLTLASWPWHRGPGEARP